jgi:ATP-dependent DNA helicase RecQ
MSYGLADMVMRKRMIEESDAPDQRKRVEHQKLNALLGYCETAECRRGVLLRYFGDTMSERCGNCDTCKRPAITWEGLKDAQLVLSAIYRTGQRFGAGYIIDLVRGIENERNVRFNHSQLKLFGLGKERAAQGWHSIIRQLIAGGYIRVDFEAYGGLTLTPLSSVILKGEKEILFREDPHPTRKSVTNKEKRSRLKAESLTNDPDKALFEKLRETRLGLAKKQKVPPYVIFHDSTLLEMVAAKPKTKEELSTISGIGEKKLERYGDHFLECLRSDAKGSMAELQS